MALKNWLRERVAPRLQVSGPFRRLVGYTAPYRGRLAAGVACLLAANLLGLVSPSVLRQVIDGLSGDITHARLLRLGGVLVLVALAQGVMLFFQRRLLVGVARDMEYDLRNDFYAHLQKLPQEFYQKRRTGDLMTRATSDLAAIRMLAGMGLISTLGALFAVTLILPMMISVNWRLTLLAFAPVPLLAVLSKYFSKRMHEAARVVQESYGRVSSVAQEALTGVRVARAYRQERAEAAKFKKLNDEYVANNLTLIHLSSVFRPLLQFFVGLGFIVVFSYGGYLIVKGQLSTGQFVQQTLYLSFLVSPVASFGVVVNLYQRAMASMGRIHAIMSVTPAIRDTSEAAEGFEVAGEIEFRDLTFRYRNAAEPALKGVSLRIAPGQTVAFVGAVGSGKSTLMNLVCRLLEAEAGQLLVDGRPVREIPLRALRKAIAYVPQETVLFSETVAANIAFGTDGCGREEVERAAAAAGVAEDIKAFPRGFDTLVGERGLTLSGGQKQRVAIARALLLDPRILILDDALSAVDTQTEEQILGNLWRAALRGRTALIAAHRLSTVKNADLVVVLDEGRVVETGTHDELLTRGGLYADLYEKQLLREELTAN